LEAYLDFLQELPEITVSDMEAIGALPYVRRFEYARRLTLASETLTRPNIPWFPEASGVVHGEFQSFNFRNMFGGHHG